MKSPFAEDITPEEAKRIQVRYTLEDFAKAEHWAWLADKRAQKADDEYEILKETGKDLLALIKQRIAGGDVDKKWSDTELERRARTQKDWTTHRESQHYAQEVKGETKVASRAAQRFWETIQSGLSYKKVEAQRLPSQAS